MLGTRQMYVFHLRSHLPLRTSVNNCFKETPRPVSEIALLHGCRVQWWRDPLNQRNTTHSTRPPLSQPSATGIDALKQRNITPGIWLRNSMKPPLSQPSVTGAFENMPSIQPVSSAIELHNIRQVPEHVPAAREPLLISPNRQPNS